MSILKELNYLGEKITGENPKKARISDSLDYIIEYITNGVNDETEVSTIIHKIADNYTNGGTNLKIFDSIQAMNNDTDKHENDVAVVCSRTEENIAENTTFITIINPGNIVLDKHITEYINSQEDIEQEIAPGEEFNYTFYQDAMFMSEDGYHDFQIANMAATGGYKYDPQTDSFTDEFEYSFWIYGYYTTTEYVSQGHVTISFGFTSSDGITFVPSFKVGIYNSDTDDTVFIDANSITSEVDINLSEAEGNWGDLIGEFVVTEFYNFNGIYKVEKDANNNLVYKKITNFSTFQ